LAGGQAREDRTAGWIGEGGKSGVQTCGSHFSITIKFYNL
jgi:hypothetical protein